jgi:hypothetical protein
MFTATFYFLGVAGFVLAASICLTKGRNAGQRVDVNLADLRVASVCLLTTGSKPTWQTVRTMWANWYLRCQEKAVREQKVMYSWARTLALCATLCLMGVLLEAAYDERISVSAIVAGFVHVPPVAAGSQTPQR